MLPSLLQFQALNTYMLFCFYPIRAYIASSLPAPIHLNDRPSSSSFEMQNHEASLSNRDDVERNADTERVDGVGGTEDMEKAGDERRSTVTFNRRSFIPKWVWILAITSLFIEAILVATFIVLQLDPKSFPYVVGQSLWWSFRTQWFAIVLSLFSFICYTHFKGKRLDVEERLALKARSILVWKICFLCMTLYSWLGFLLGMAVVASAQGGLKIMKRAFSR